MKARYTWLQAKLHMMKRWSSAGTMRMSAEVEYWRTLKLQKPSQHKTLRLCRIWLASQAAPHRSHVGRNNETAFSSTQVERVHQRQRPACAHTKPFSFLIFFSPCFFSNGAFCWHGMAIVLTLWHWKRWKNHCDNGSMTADFPSLHSSVNVSALLDLTIPIYHSLIYNTYFCQSTQAPPFFFLWSTADPYNQNLKVLNQIII